MADGRAQHEAEQYIDAARRGNDDSGYKMASENFSKDVFRRLVLAHVIKADISMEMLAEKSGITLQGLDEVGAGRQDVQLSVYGESVSYLG